MPDGDNLSAHARPRPWCWGSAQSGQLGNGTTVSQQQGEHAVFQVPGTWWDIQADQGYSCGIAQDGGRWCWGGNAGRFGDGTTHDSLVPAKMPSSWQQVALGWVSSCGVTSAGTAMCWGSNGNGLLGNNSTTDSLVPVEIWTGGS